jgi:hypothetical protein
MQHVPDIAALVKAAVGEGKLTRFITQVPETTRMECGYTEIGSHEGKLDLILQAAPETAS